MMVKKKIENEEIKEAIIINQENEKIKVLYIVENKTTMNEVPGRDVMNCSNIRILLTFKNLLKFGLTEQQLQSITPNFEFDIEQTEEKSASGNILVMMLMSMSITLCDILFVHIKYQAR